MVRPVLLVLCLALLAPAAASANPNQLSLMQDDDLLLYRDAQTRDSALTQMKGLGVDGVRVTVLWSVAAQDARKTPARVRRFKGNVPATYPSVNWDRYDNLVRSATRMGLVPYFSVTGPGPDWAHAVAPASQRRSRKTWRPKVSEFKKFVSALGKRYSGTYRDENQGRRVLPRVSFWGLWNEPNQGGWLTPQYSGGIPASPHIYRRLFLYGRQALEATGHGRDTILLGETAPLGSNKTTSRSPIGPAKFIREMLCVDAANRPFTGAAAARRNCDDFQKLGNLRTNGYGHHPYTKNVGPTQRDPHPDSLTMANLDDLPKLLDAVSASTGAKVPANLPVYMTEFGFETNPPDPFSGVPLERQAQWNTEGELLAWAHPRVAALTQFILRDVAPVARARRGTKPYWFTYQSGLFFNNNTPKPAAAAYAFPFVAGRVGAEGVSVWGQLRFRPNGATEQVALQYKPEGGEYTTVGELLTVTNDKGYFTAQIPYQGPGTYRAVWGGATFPFFNFSREIRL